VLSCVVALKFARKELRVHSVLNKSISVAQGKDRRCVYSDGDVEDMSMLELYELSRTGKEQRGGKMKKTSSGEHQPNKRAEDSSQRGRKRNSRTSDPPKPKILKARQGHTEPLFESSEIVPIDEAAEATLVTASVAKGLTEQPEEDENDERMTDMWLEQIASRFVKSKGNKGMTQKNKSHVDTGRPGCNAPAEGIHNTSSPNSPKANTSTSSGLQSLADMKTGSRFGAKVFHIDDPLRVVGEVRLLIFLLVASSNVFVADAFVFLATDSGRKQGLDRGTLWLRPDKRALFAFCRGTR
jgi:hypothetical protein